MWHYRNRKKKCIFVGKNRIKTRPDSLTNQRLDSSKLNDVKRVNFVVQNRKVNNFNRCIIASISYNFNSFKDKYNGSGSAEDEINRF